MALTLPAALQNAGATFHIPLRWLALLWLLCAGAFAHAQDTYEAYSPVVSYVFEDGLDGAEAFSPVVSYVFGDSLASEDAYSPVVSYVFEEALPDDVLTAFSSAPVSYFYNVGTGTTPVTVQGRVVDRTGNGIGNATVSALLFTQTAASATTDATGGYTLPPLLPGVYELAASAPSLGRDRRVVNLSGAMPQQNFLLRELPPATVVKDTPRTPKPTEIPSPVSVEGSQLKVFDGTRFVPNLALLDKSRMTVVLTHGWIICGQPGGIDYWPTDIAKALRRAGLTAAKANIVAWDWHDAANPCLPPNPPEEKTPEQGHALGEALYAALHADYAQHIHFLGHSLGAIVNACAANYLHGTPRAHEETAPEPWDFGRTHVTLFDEAEIARIGGKEVFWDGLSAVITGDQAAVFQEVLVAAKGWKGPIPSKAAWVDNYISSVGLYHASALNVCLERKLLETGNAVAAHSYPQEWYAGSISNLPDSLLGFTRTFEATLLPGTSGNLFPPTEAEFVLGDAYHQVRGAADELSLELVPVARLYECFIPAIGLTAEFILDRSVAAAEKVGEVVINTTEQVTIAAYNGVTYVGGKVLDAGGQAIDLVTRSGWQLILKTGSMIHLGGNIVRQGALDGPTNAPAYVWLPVFIPADATGMAFDYSVAGDPRDDRVAFGLNGTNVFSIAGKFVPENEASASRLIDVSAYAGSTNELFFGVTGGSSTNCTVKVENLRFFTLQAPQLTVESAGDTVVLSWPSTANGYVVESATNVMATDWVALTQSPALFGGRFSVTNAITGEAQFFRLGRQ